MPESALIFLLLYVLGLTLAIFVRPIFGLYTYLAVFYLHPPSRWWGDALPDLRWSLIAAGVTLMSLFLHRESLNNRQPWHRSTIARVLILYTTWMWLQLLWVESPWHLRGVVLFTKYLVLFYLMYILLDDKSKLRDFCWANVLGCGIFGWLVYLAPAQGRLEGVGGPGVDDANTLAMHLSIGLMFAGFLLIATRSWKRWTIVLAIPLILNGIIQAESRGALVGLFVGGLVTIYLKPKRFRRAYYGLAVLGLIGAIMLANETFLSRMSTLNAVIDEQQEVDGSAMGRIETLKAQLIMFRSHPFGVGHEGTTYLSATYLDERWLAGTGDRASHNTVMSVLVDQGIPGVILCLILALSIIGSLRRLKALDQQGLPDDLGLYRTMLGGALAAVFCSGMFAQYLKAEIQIWCLALLAILWGFAQDFEYQRREHEATGENMEESRF